MVRNGGVYLINEVVDRSSQRMGRGSSLFSYVRDKVMVWSRLDVRKELRGGAEHYLIGPTFITLTVLAEENTHLHSC